MPERVFLPYPFDDTNSEAIRSYCEPLLEARERAQDNTQTWFGLSIETVLRG